MKFANDAWRIFCKDDLYIGAGYSITTPVLKKVLLTDEKLNANLRDRWDKEGFIEDESTGSLAGTVCKTTGQGDGRHRGSRNSEFYNIERL